ncbi:DNA-binding response OmpR family regulator [Bradyrhizobium sp. AZCC 1577]|uniref:hypothetical protein n=1 Tax=Bradyrhizobium sp. AZCC 1577 TaxID=3117019 RepID=UPI002FF20924
MRVVLTGDSSPLHVGLKAGLPRLGFGVENAPVSPGGQACPCKSSFDGIALDLANPERTGRDLAPGLRIADDRIPLPALTTDGAEERVRWLDAEADACIVKPVDLDEIAARPRASPPASDIYRIVNPRVD